MATPVKLESEEHLHRLVKEHETLIVSCFPSSEDGDSGQDLVLHQELISGVTSTVLCRINLNTVRAAGMLLPDDQDGGEGDDARVRQELWWLFFRGGEMVYAAAGGSSATQGPKLSRLAALLERSPDTLAQLSRQDQVSRRQKRRQKIAADADAAAADEDRGENVAQHRQQGGTGGKGEPRAGSRGPGGDEGGPPAGDGRGAPALIFVAGDRSQVGKSSTCLGLLGSLLRQPGFRPSDLAYIKPATQCEKPQLVTEWCESNGVACRGIGPVVFYKGFTREFLKGGAGTSEDLLQEIKDAVGEISLGKQVVVVDGVGYPAVGSICGVSNGDVAAALSAPVLLVGKSGVGDAVDSYNLNACFFEARGVRVLGGVFNRISTTGYYSLERCREAVTSYFAQANPSALPYGFVPEIASLKTAAVSLGTGATMVVPATTPAKAVAASAPKDPADFSSPAGATSTYAGGGGEGGAGSRDEGVPEPAAADGATEKAAPTGKPLSVAGVESEEDLESFLTAVGSGTLVLLDFGAEWCKNCKAMLPFVHGLPERLGGAVAVATADVDEAADLADSRDVSTIPHFVLLKHGVQVDTYTGSSETELLSKLTEHLPSVESPDTGPASGAGETTGVGSGGTGSGRGPGSDGNGRKEEEEKFASVTLVAAEALIDAFDKNVDVARLLRDVRHHPAAARHGYGPFSALPLPPADKTTNAVGSDSGRSRVTAAAAAGVAQLGGGSGGVLGGDSESSPGASAAKKPVAASSSRRRREEVEAEAAKQGASGG